VAAVQGKVKDFFQRVGQLGFQAVEISEDMLSQPLPSSQREAFIHLAKDMGLEVFTELGRKFPDAPLERKEVVESSLRDLKAGAKKVVIENSDLVKLKEEDPTFFTDVLREVGKEQLIFEAGPAQWPELAAWIIQTLGRTSNLRILQTKRSLCLMP
jgi:phosphosulfolactate synthase (CoM biosynthesis protein A)